MYGTLNTKQEGDHNIGHAPPLRPITAITSTPHCETQYEMPTNAQATLAGRNQESYEKKALVVKSPIP